MACNVAADLGNGSLPVLGSGKLATIRKSKRSRWRAGVLISIHVLVAAHVAHFLITGRTLSPVEPSEAAYALEQGVVRAGFIFFVVAMLGTLIFGRFFCGWGCHIVALQDLCGFLMKKAGVRPKPFRSRFLAFAPLAVAFYLFAWPALHRYVFANPASAFPGFASHLTTNDFWQTFPGPVMGVLTLLTCGFAAVYFLGAKGFCTYGCPYGAFFGPIDTLSTGRIVVNDGCEQCGHCTATCTSNVRVHEEVKLYGMVVDPGCMKCTDCVSVCPKGALRFAFARPSLFKRAPTTPRAKRFDLSLPDELSLAAIFLFATLAFFRLYDGPPLLMSAGLGAVTAFVSLKLSHLFRKANVGIQSVVLKSAGRVRGRGWLFAFLAVLWLSFTVHSAFVQWHRARGISYLSRSEATREDVMSWAFKQKRYSPQHDVAAAEALRHLSLAQRWGIFDVMDVNLGLSWANLLNSDLDGAEAAARRAVAIAPDQRKTTLGNLVDVLVAGRRFSKAVEAMEEKVELGEPSAADHFQLGWLSAQTGRMEEAVREARACLALAPQSADAELNLGTFLRGLGRHGESLEHLRAARDLSPGNAATHVEIGLTYMAMGVDDEALQSFKRAVELEPDMPESPVPVRGLIDRLVRSNNEKAPVPKPSVRESSRL